MVQAHAVRNPATGRVKSLARAVAVAACLAFLPSPAAAAPFCDSGWCLQNPQDPALAGVDLKGVWGASGSDVFAVGNGAILHYDGAAWSRMASVANGWLQGVWGASGSDVFAVGYDLATGNGLVLHYDGTAWSVMTAGTADLMPLTGVWGTAGSDVFAVGGWGTILHYDGTAWSAMTSGTTSSLNAVWGSSGSDVFAVGYNPLAPGGMILHYDGSSWSAMASGTFFSLNAVWGASGTDVFAVGFSGAILHYDGAAWSAMASGTTAELSGVWGAPGGGVFAVGSRQNALNSPEPAVLRFNGSTWVAMTPGSTGVPALLGVWGASGADVFAVGGSGLLHFDGASWSLMSSVNTSSLQAVWGSGGGDLFAVGLTGTLHGDGAAWSSMYPGSGPWLLGVWGASGSDVFAVGSGIHRFNGASWTVTNPATPTLESVWGASATDVFAVGNGGTIMHFDGTSWSAMESGTDLDLFGVWGASGSDVFAVGYDWQTGEGLILHYDGASWSAMTAGTAGLPMLFGVWGTSGTDVFTVGYDASTDAGTIQHYDGVSWSPMTAGTAGLPRLSGVWGSSGSDVFAVGSGVFHYDGVSWSPMLASPPAYLTGVWGSAGNNVYAVGGGGTILHYSGPGPSWLSAGDGTNPAAVAVSWQNVAGETGYRVYRAVGGSPNFTAIADVAADVAAYNDALGCGGGTHYDYAVAVVYPGESLSALSPVDSGFTAICPPTALTLVAPAGAIATTTPTYTWNAQAGVESYNLWVGTSTTTVLSVWYTAAAAGCGTGAGLCSVKPATALTPGALFFNVKGQNVSGTGPWTASKAFTASTTPTAVTLVSFPGPMAISTPTYRWNAMMGVDSYQLWVGTGSTTVLSVWYSAAAAGCAAGYGECSATPATALAEGAWFFNVKGQNGLGTGSWATSKSVVYTLATVPTALSLVSPSGPVATSTPTYVWNARAGVDSYQLWVGNGATTVLTVWYTAAAAGCGAGTGTCSVTPATALAAGAWFFNVQGRNLAGTGPWTAAKGFSTP